MAGTISATIKINDAFTATFNKLKSGLAGSTDAMNKLKNNAGSAGKGGMFKQFLGANVIGAGITKGISMVGAGVSSMVGELNESSKAWQTFEGNMNMIGKSPAQIAQTKGSLQKFAQQTIYSASDMASTYSQLAAVGTKNTGKLVKGFGGLAAASSDPQQAMKTLSQQATQAAAKPQIQWQDFKLMMEQTPAGMAMVAKTMHRSMGQLVKDVQGGKVKTKDFFAAIATTGTNKNFSKMATQYKTVGQAMDGLKETLAGKLQSAFDRAGKVGINAISGITDLIGDINFDGIADGIMGLGPKIMAGIQPLKMVAPYVLAAVGAFAGLSAISSILTGVSAGVEAAGMGLITFVTKLQAMPAQILSVFSTIGSAFGAIGAPIIIALAAVTVAIVAAVYAWQTNFMGVRDFLSSIFSNMGSIFAPLVSAFDELKSALAPVASVFLPMLGKALGMIGVGVIVGIALGFAALADALRMVVSVGAAVVHAFMAIAYGAKAVFQALTGNFSGSFKSLDKAKDSINGIGDALSHIGGKSATGQVIASLDELGSKATSTKSKLSNIQVKPKLDTSNVFSQMDSMTTNKTAKVNVKPELQAGANPFATIQAQADAKPAKVKVEADTSGTANPMQKIQSQATANPIKAKVQADTSTTGNPLEKLKQQASTTTIKPKVATPKVPTPTMPKGQTMRVKVAKPKVPAPTMPKVPTLHVKVATPKIPTPTAPKISTISAPHVSKPSMAGVVSSVGAGMRGAAAAARSGAAGISSAVRAAVASAVSAARAGAGAMRSAGVMIGAGLAGGMRSQVGAVAAAANALVAQANRAARAAAKIHSPSRVFAEIGDYMGQGMAVGMDGTSSLVAASGASMAHSAVGGARGATMPGVNPNASTPSHSPFIRGAMPAAGTTNYATSNTSQQSGNATHITFAAGAIQIQGTGNAGYDGEKIAAALETHLVNLNERRG